MPIIPQFVKLNWGEAVAKIIKIQRTNNPIWKLQTLLAAVQSIHDSFNQMDLQVSFESSGVAFEFSSLAAFLTVLSLFFAVSGITCARC